MKKLAVLWLCLCPMWAMAAERCINTTGEAVIDANDLASAKLEALSRAKWAAIEQIAGVQIQSSSLLQDMALVDETVVQKTNGVVRSAKVLKGERQGDVYVLQAKVCVSKAAAEQSLSVLTRNTAVGVLIVTRSRHESGVVETADMRLSREYSSLRVDEDPLSGRLKQGLLDQDVEVVDLSSKLQLSGAALASSMRRNDRNLLRRAMLASMANVLIFGRIDNVISTRKGADIGYGLSMPLHKVTAHFQYKVLGHDAKGATRVLYAGSSEGLGMATALEDANQQAMQDLSEQIAHTIIDRILSQIDGKARVFDVQIAAVPNVDVHELIKDRLHQLQWVQQVEDRGTGHFRMKYLERPIYLANSLQRVQGVHVRNFTQDSIRAVYQQP